MTPSFSSPYNGALSNFWEVRLEPSQVARTLVEAASDMQAEDIVMLDIRTLTTLADYFVIMSAGTQRQLNALQEQLVQSLKDKGVRLHHREGRVDSGWVLLDFSDVVVHLFDVERRDFYQLEELWSQATEVVRVL